MSKPAAATKPNPDRAVIMADLLARFFAAKEQHA